MNFRFKHPVVLFALLFFMFSCGNNSFYKQKFTNLKGIKAVDEVQEVEGASYDDNVLPIEAQVETVGRTKEEIPLEMESELPDISTNSVGVDEQAVLQDKPHETPLEEGNQLALEETKVLDSGNKDSDVDGGRVTIIVLFWLAVALLIAAIIYAVLIALEGAVLAALWPASIMSGIALLIFVTLYLLSLLGVLDLGFIAVMSNVLAGFALCIPLLHFVLHLVYG